MKRFLLLAAILLIIGGLAGAWLIYEMNGGQPPAGETGSQEGNADSGTTGANGTAGESESEGSTGHSGSTVPEALLPSLKAGDLVLEEIPPYDSEPYTEINRGKPFFLAGLPQKDLTLAEWFKSLVSDKNSFGPVYEYYGELDPIGRCTGAEALLGEELIPEEERGDIQNIRPTGWHSVKYAGIDKEYLYNRCHLIAFILAGENDNEKNLITGTRYLNIEGMEPFELEVLSYLIETGNHVLYRVTPVFAGDELVARGVLMEAYSLEDRGKEICFCVYCYNVQPGITIDYATGESRGPGERS